MEILYIIVRDDLDSMNPGKGMAQASHAASDFHAVAETHWKIYFPKLYDNYQTWKKQAGHFGTVIVLAGSIDDMNTIERKLTSRREDFFLGKVVDPTYPVRDGNITHLIPLVTCMWGFGNNENLSFTDLFKELKLYP